ncbi:GTP cyclohydrolase I FolE [Moraxella nonliquefaciens]|jgi:GTP cyclohydrolase I|uniref:GTP cyclohydrolase 1 n=1 Tax=Moraxella nonliquefaciens TaxID=478 RepID=A0A7T3C052_MORNO|nr:GTP cyclohydrolase I FolE [Moraxella nonliquefaciens]MCG7412783.1 GTP cyclohydrolase I FolE [Moraxella nonliquefaciens]MDI4498169.1 GTP cyclohydrolase I FolE [Moraxella nonliquefaciens]MDI4499933.1 GTP cyclohydrolase I FolE [Moraxella nonliquefaciens]QPT44184.1 GTP cyclohydrolase I FolE [Moraxella nonliquefaciens]QQC29203.1 GTP cyclohydrolase I FolE [Moraxella nonliquefaciens]
MCQHCDCDSPANPTFSFNAKDTAQHYANIILASGENLHREGLLDTPMRAAKAFGDLTAGYHQDLHTVANGAIFASDNPDLVLVQNIEFYSLCEHHILPFFGVAHIGYLPDGKVLGLSKLARIVDMYAKRLQIQENLTKQIAQAIHELTDCRGVAVVMDASHMCMMMRGVGKQQSTTRTTCMLGVYETDSQARMEFLSTIPKRVPAFG